MTEYYNLPVQFTEDEREKYAAWGIKKEKVTTPFTVLFLLLDVLAGASTICILANIFGGVQMANFLIRTDSAVSTLVFDVCFIGLGFLTIKPLDMLFDKIFQRPQDPRMLRLEPGIAGMQYKLFRKKDMLCKGVLSWEEWESAVLPETNQIWIEEECLHIGANTIDTIYPKGKRHKWMECPDEKIVGTIQLKKIQRLMKGYLASLEEQKREVEWRRQSECDVCP